MKVALLDVNVLVALAWPSHIHHEAAHRWFAEEQHYGWATCPLTQSALVRLSSNSKMLADAVTPMEAIELLAKITAMPSHHFWADDLSLADGVVFREGYVVGHRQITDAYLYSLAIARQARLVTFDKGVAALYPAVAAEHLLILG
ncbi:MAG: TA system VapC family ribonuclease toxin [Thiolinea sp.]